MDANWWLALLLAVVAATPGIYTIWQNRNKIPAAVHKSVLDNKSDEVTLTDKYEKQLNQMAAYNIGLRNEIQELRVVIDITSQKHAAELNSIKARYETEMADIRASLLKTEERAQMVEDWAARLCSQIESLGEKPVPFEPLKRNSRPVK